MLGEKMNDVTSGFQFVTGSATTTNVTNAFEPGLNELKYVDAPFMHTKCT